MSDNISLIDTQELVAYVAAVREMLDAVLGQLSNTGWIIGEQQIVLQSSQVRDLETLDRRTRTLERRLRG